MNRSQLGFLFVLVATMALVGCGGGAPAPEPEPTPAPAPAPPPEPVPVTATATLQGRSGTEVAGTVTFTQTGGSVHVVAEVSGVGAAGEHGLHVHETGDCSAEDFTSAGGHFNPTDGIHGGPAAEERHAGDLGNITIGEDGTGRLELTTDLLTVGAGANSVVGKAVILHEKADDLVSQPTGAAGGRIGCGVVQ